MPKGLDYIINLKDGNLTGAKKAKDQVSGLDDAVGKAEKNINGFGSTVMKVGGMLAGAFAISGLVGFGGAARDAFMAGEKAAAQANQAIITTGGLAGKTIDELKAKADMWESKTLFGDEDVLNADSLLLTFTNIRGKIYDQAMPAILDMAQRMGGDGPADLKGASLQLGKALNDPITGIGALKRVGVSFSDSQKDMIATAMKHGDVQKAQGIILAEVSKEFGGSAEAARKVLGPAGDLDYQVNKLKDGFGELLMGGINPITSGLVTVVKHLRDGVAWISQNKDLVKTLAVELGIAAGVYVVASTGMGIYTAWQAASAAATGGMTVAQWALNAAMTANPVGVIVGGIALLVGGLTIAYKKSETFRGIIAGIGEVASGIIPIFKGLGEVILGALTFNPTMIKRGFDEAVGGVKDFVMKGGAGGLFAKGYTGSIEESRKAALAEGTTKKTSASGLAAGKTKGDPFAVSAGKTKGGGAGSDATTVSGGSSVRNVQITINKLVEKLEVHTTNLQAGSADIKRQITELLVGVVHDSELALGS